MMGNPVIGGSARGIQSRDSCPPLKTYPVPILVHSIKSINDVATYSIHHARPQEYLVPAIESTPN